MYLKKEGYIVLSFDARMDLHHVLSFDEMIITVSNDYQMYYHYYDFETLFMYWLYLLIDYHNVLSFGTRMDLHHVLSW